MGEGQGLLGLQPPGFQEGGLQQMPQMPFHHTFTSSRVNSEVHLSLASFLPLFQAPATLASGSGCVGHHLSSATSPAIPMSIWILFQTQRASWHPTIHWTDHPLPAAVHCLLPQQWTAQIF